MILSKERCFEKIGDLNSTKSCQDSDVPEKAIEKSDLPAKSFKINYELFLDFGHLTLNESIQSIKLSFLPKAKGNYITVSCPPPACVYDTA